MSGIVGIIHGDGTPVDAALLCKLTSCLSFRGPDAQSSWNRGSAGLGCALFRDTVESQAEEQPASTDGQVWIVADARLDARRTLIENLRAAGRNASEELPDSHLLLHAYAVWQENCVAHLQGDFSFGIWDSPRQRLFCATDHFGIRKIYFADMGAAFLFSNTLDCLRLHPAVSARLNESAIADFLLFGLNCDPAATSFRDIQRLPRAHCLTWTPHEMQMREYWRPPMEGPLHRRHRREYIEELGSLLNVAVADRLRTQRAGIFLSGGLDSSSVAAIACGLAGSASQPVELHAFTMAEGEPGNRSDESAARAVASALHIPLHVFPPKDEPPMQEWDGSGNRTPEPSEDPPTSAVKEDFRAIAAIAPVVMSGEGSDNLLEFEMRHHLETLWREMRFSRFTWDLLEHVIRRFWAPDGIAGPMRRFRRLGSRSREALFPAWIHEALTARLDLKRRWDTYHENFKTSSHPVHPAAYASLFLPQWDALFEHLDPGYTRAPFHVTYPFLDLRVVRFLLRVPSMPWAFRKFLLRELMRGRLPQKIRMRPKRPAQSDPLVQELRNGGAARLRRLALSPELEAFLNMKSLPDPFPPGGDTESVIAEVCLRARIWSLNKWLQSFTFAPKLLLDEQSRAEQPAIAAKKTLRIPCP